VYKENLVFIPQNMGSVGRKILAMGLHEIEEIKCTWLKKIQEMR
jgi:hypothetical protein